jgi:nitrite reductase (NADH) small subunit
MPDYLLGKLDDLPEGSGRAFKAGARTVAVFRSQGRVFAIANRCLHKGASLCDGEVAENGTVVRCPWHNWSFELATGTLCRDRSERLRTFDVKIVGDQVILSA